LHRRRAAPAGSAHAGRALQQAAAEPAAPAEHPAFAYHYTTALYSPDDVIQEKYLGLEPEYAAQCASLCNRTIGGSCKVQGGGVSRQGARCGG
jgi:hypothetical protein